MVYFDRAWFGVLVAAEVVLLQADALVIVRTAEQGERRIPYDRLTEREMLATLHFVGLRTERIQRGET